MKDYCEIVSEYLNYNPPCYREKDYKKYWENNFELNRKTPLNLEIVFDSKDEKRENYHIYFDGCDGSRIHGIMIKPNEEGKLPLFVNYHGFCADCGKFEDFYIFSDEGYLVISLDIRGQGGKSENLYKYTFGENIMQFGCLDENEYYLKWVILDCIRAIDAGCSLDYCDKEMVIVNGASQGGALSMTMAGLDKRVKYCFCEVPSNSDIRERINKRAGSLGALRDLITENKVSEERIFKTVSYFDTMNMADDVTAHIFAAVGLKDDICPPKQFFATYNKIKAPKTVDFYYEAGHGGVMGGQDAKKPEFLKLIKEKIKEK